MSKPGKGPLGYHGWIFSTEIPCTVGGYREGVTVLLRPSGEVRIYGSDDEIRMVLERLKERGIDLKEGENLPCF